MSDYSDKYGFDGQAKAILAFHRKRRMFVVKDDILKLAPVASVLSHAEWFECLGWIRPDHDELMEKLTRGYVDSDGVYAYTGYDFRVTDAVKKDVIKHINELSKMLGLLPSTKVYLGLTKPTSSSSNWKPTEDIGSIESLMISQPNNY